ncbi:Uncharacterised protein [Pasteurella multocida subsp. gallicida]|nr:Uncharacterised protein [Pasteurella multocida subsp. gallicida]
MDYEIKLKDVLTNKKLPHKLNMIRTASAIKSDVEWRDFKKVMHYYGENLIKRWLPDSNRIMTDTDVALPPTFPVGNPPPHFHYTPKQFLINKEKPVLKIDINDQQVGIKLQQIAIQLQHPRKLYGVLGETLKKRIKNVLSKKLIPRVKNGKRSHLSLSH